MSAWAPMVPFAKTRLGINDADLGLILLALGGGAMLTMPLSGVLINRFSSRATMIGGAIVMVGALPFLASAPTPLLLGVSLFCFGAGCGALDVAMNAQAVVVEQKMNKIIMSSFHGLFSVGGLLGAVIVSFLLNQGLSILGAALGIVALAGVIGLIFFRQLLPPSEDHKVTGSALVLPRGPVVVLGVLAFISFLAEGALLDWSAVFLRFERGFSVDNAGIGYAIFSAAMTVGRFTGDRVAHALGPVPTLRYGALLAAAGYFLFVLVPYDWASFVGFAGIGLGLANVVPLMFSAAGRLKDLSPSISIPAVTTMGYAGLLAGPALIGFIGHATNLLVGLGGVGVALLVVAASARVVGK